MFQDYSEACGDPSFLPLWKLLNNEHLACALHMCVCMCAWLVDYTCFHDMNS